MVVERVVELPRVDALAQQVQQHPGIDVAGPRAHHQAL